MDGVTTIDDQPKIEFRSVVEDDYSMLLRWRSRPHVRAFYQKTPPSADAIAAKYGPIAAGVSPTISHIASLGGAPFGCLQCYRNQDYPDWASLIGHDEGVSIDLFIGEATCLGRGLGRAMLAGYVREVTLRCFPEEHAAYIAHDVANLAAVACSKSVGFVPLGSFVEDGVPMLLLRLGRDQLSPSLASSSRPGGSARRRLRSGARAEHGT